MGTVIKAGLSAASLRKAAEEVEKYRESLHDKCTLFRQRLIEVGIDTAKSNCGEYAGMIVFESENVDDKTSLLVATDGRKVIREWRYKGGIKTAEVSPLLMSEFGSGAFAEVLLDVAGVGRGTFPGQKHAFDDNGWSWVTPDNEFHRSKGESPTHPMYGACVVMRNMLTEIAKEVFETNEVIRC